MKSLKITTLIIIAILTISALSIHTTPQPSQVEQAETYQKLKKESAPMVGVIKRDKKPPTT